MRDFYGAVNDWAYFYRLLSFEHVANKHTTKTFCWALVTTTGKARWWKLRRKDYALFKEVDATRYVKS